jgi:hypothetical protein
MQIRMVTGIAPTWEADVDGLAGAQAQRRPARAMHPQPGFAVALACEKKFAMIAA